jgi:hypothetical protein
MSLAYIAILLQAIGFIGCALYALWMKDIRSDVKDLRKDLTSLGKKVAAYTGDANGGN